MYIMDRELLDSLIIAISKLGHLNFPSSTVSNSYNMHPSFLLPPPFLLFEAFLFISILFLTCFATDDELYTACSPLNCGNFTEITYPFWRDSRLEHCGHPKFKLSCSDNLALIEIGSDQFLVLDISITTQILKISILDFYGSICPGVYSNMSLDFDFYQYTSNDENSTLLYDCNHVVNASASGPNFNFTCLMFNTSLHGDANFVRGTNFSDMSRLGCSIYMTVPVLSEAVDSFSKSENSSLDVGYILEQGFEVRWAVDEAICQNCRRSGGKCGYDVTTEEFRCFCPDQPYATTCASKLSSPPPSRNHTKVRYKVIIYIICGIVGVLFICIAICCLATKWLKKSWMMSKRNDNIEAFIRKHEALAQKRYKFSEVKKMTNSFKVKIGQGGFGDVYKGELPTLGFVAVKLLNESKRNGEEFINEVASISETSHVNIVTLHGFCIEGKSRALVYEYMPKESLEKYIHQKGAEANSGLSILSWEKLHHIAVGIARGLEYLHKGCKIKILHLDIKPHNILLDENFYPKISDFGLAKLCPSRESIISMSDTRGTPSYRAPELTNKNLGGVSHKSDVYSYGMMLLEMAGGRKNLDAEVSRSSEVYYPHWVYNNLEMGNTVVHRGVTTTEESEIAKKMSLVGLWCIQTIPTHRPAISRVIEMLEGSIDSLPMPPKPSMS